MNGIHCDNIHCPKCWGPVQDELRTTPRKLTYIHIIEVYLRHNPDNHLDCPGTPGDTNGRGSHVRIPTTIQTNENRHESSTRNNSTVAEDPADLEGEEWREPSLTITHAPLSARIVITARPIIEEDTINGFRLVKCSTGQ